MPKSLPPNQLKNFVSLFFIILLTLGLSSCSFTSDAKTERSEILPIENLEEKPDQHFFFVQLTDTHFETGDNIARSHKAIERINNLSMDIQCVVHTGDILTIDKMEDSLLQAYLDTSLAIMGNIKVPVHYVPGNHDIFPDKADTTAKIFRKYFGELISSAEYEGVVFIFVFTETLRKSFIIEGYDPLAELEVYLQKAKQENKPVLVFHHSPSVKWDDDVREKWIKLLNDYNVKGVIAGHHHRDELFWLNTVPLYVSPPVSGWWGRQATYRIYEYNNGKLGYTTKYYWKE